MSGIARLFTGVEAAEMAETMPQCELDHRLMASLHTAIPWATNPDVQCAVCNAPLGGRTAYVMILLPVDPEMGLGVSGGVCGSCGGLPRIQLEAHATRIAMLMFEPPQGRA